MSAAMASNTSVVYVRLLEEGTSVYRPVHAVSLGAGSYRLEAPTSGDDPEDVWEFPRGSVVTCEPRLIEDEELLVATALRAG